MEPKDAGARIIWLKSTESTNSELRRHLDDVDNLSIIATEEQTAGRGQGDHSWYSRPGQSLTFSILYRFDGEHTLLAGDALLITQLTTLAILDYLRGKGVEARIKWPNDIWVDGRKICGILIENALSAGRILESIAGIGLNINETLWPTELPNPVSLREITGRSYDLRTELETLHKKICRRFGSLASPDGRKSLQEEFGNFVFRLPGGPQ